MKTKFIFPLLVLILMMLISSYRLKGQAVIFSGYVLDTSKNQPVSDAIIEIENSNEKGLTGKDGRFSFNISGSDTLYILIKALNYQIHREKIIIPKDKKIFEHNFYVSSCQKDLKEYNMKSVLVLGKRLHEMTIPTYNIKLENLLELPIIAERDIFRAAQILPSVARENDFSSKLVIRGASHYQHLILFDDVPVFNTFHYGGLIGIFNTDIIGEANLYSSCYPPEYGGVSSSVFNVKSKDKYTGKMDLRGSLGLITSSLAFSDKIGEGILTLAGRRTYLDFISRIFNEKFPYYNYDLFGKYKYIIDSNNILTGSILFTKDVYDILSYDPSHFNYIGDQITPQWGNFIPYIRWEYFPSPYQNINLLIYYSLSTVRSSSNQQMKDSPTYKDRIEIDNSVSQMGIKGKYGFKIKNNEFLIGFEYFNQKYDYNWEIQSQQFVNEIASPEEVFFDFAPSNYKNSTSRTNLAFFAHTKLLLFDDYSFSLGGRVEYPSDQKQYFFNPYLSFSYSPSEFVSFCLSYGRYNQLLVIYDDRKINLIFNNIFEVVFFPEKDNLPISNHYTINVKLNEIIHGLNLRMEGYFIQRDGIPFILYSDRNKYKYSEYTMGYDVFLNYTGEIFNGIISYTCGKSIRKERNSRFLGNYDQRNLLKAFLGCEITKKWNISFEFYMSSGMPYSLPSYSFFGANLENTSLNDQFGNPDIDIGIPLYKNSIYRYRNTERSPFYRRLDMTLTYNFYLWEMKMKTYLTIINLLDQDNSTLYGVEINDPEKKKSLQGIPLIPVIGVYFEK